MLLLKSAILLCLAAGAAAADPLEQMGGTWRGAGWAKQTPQGPQETVRCKITNAYDVPSRTLTLSGQCVVPGQRLSISGTLTGSEGSERVTGRWSNPDGIGRVPVVGLQRDGIVAFNFSAIDPSTGQKVAQNVEWRVAAGALRLRSTDRADPSIMLSDISFSQ